MIKVVICKYRCCFYCYCALSCCYDVLVNFVIVVLLLLLMCSLLFCIVIVLHTGSCHTNSIGTKRKRDYVPKIKSNRCESQREEEEEEVKCHSYFVLGMQCVLLLVWCLCRKLSVVYHSRCCICYLLHSTIWVPLYSLVMPPFRQRTRHRYNVTCFVDGKRMRDQKNDVTVNSGTYSTVDKCNQIDCCWSQRTLLTNQTREIVRANVLMLWQHTVYAQAFFHHSLAAK